MVATDFAAIDPENSLGTALGERRRDWA